MSKRGRFISLAMLIASVSFVSTPGGIAEERFGSFLGTVTDPTGAVLPDVAVSLTNKENGRSLNTRTDGSGAYVFRQIEPGHYTLTFEKSGFSNYRIEDAL